MQDRFKQIRAHFGLSQAQFAQRINKSPGFISNVETGRSNVSDETINAVCATFSVNEKWLRNGEGEMFLSGYDHSPVNKENVGSRIKEIRKAAGLTQEQFGKAVGYSKMQIHFVEIGKVTPSNDFLHKVAVAFEISQEWLMTGIGEMKAIVEEGVDDRLLNWLREHPEVVRELRKRGGLD